MLQKVLDHHGITAYKLGKDVDFSNAAIGNMLAGKTNPSFEFLSRLMELFPVLNANWLVKGRGDMFVDDSIRPKGFRSHPPDLLEAKEEIIRLLNENMRMKDEKILRLTEELTNQKRGSVARGEREEDLVEIKG
jgi:transcriptional regulator with XRE-family HTH domain